MCAGIYIVINVGVVVATLGKEIIVRVCGWRAADSLFKEMLHVILLLQIVIDIRNDTPALLCVYCYIESGESLIHSIMILLSLIYNHRPYCMPR